MKYEKAAVVILSLAMIASAIHPQVEGLNPVTPEGIARAVIGVIVIWILFGLLQRLGA